MTVLESPVASPVGTIPVPLVVHARCWNTVSGQHDGFLAGEAVEFDFAGALDTVDETIPGVSGGIYVNAHSPSVEGTKTGRIHGVVLEDVAQGGITEVQVTGVVDRLYLPGGTAPRGSPLYLVAVGDAGVEDGKRIRGYVLESYTVRGLAYARALFDGIRGFAQIVPAGGGGGGGSSGGGGGSSGGGGGSSGGGGGSSSGGGPPGGDVPVSSGAVVAVQNGTMDFQVAGTEGQGPPGPGGSP